MTGNPRQRPSPTETIRPGEVTVPQLAREEVQRRAEAGFDRTVNSILAPQFREARSDLTLLRNSILQRQRALPPDAAEETRNAATQAAIDAFVQQKPNSPLTQYINAGNSVVDGLSWEWRGRNVTFNLTMRPVADLERFLRAPFDQSRSAVVSQLVAASEPLSSTQSRTNFVTLSGMDPGLAQQLGDGLSRELGIGPNRSIPRGHLPITIAYDAELGTPRLAVNYSGPRRASEMDMSRGG